MNYHTLNDFRENQTYQPRFVVSGTTIVTSHAVVFPKGAIELSEFSQLHASEVVLVFRHLNPLSDDLFNLK